MKLHAFKRQMPMPYAHGNALPGRRDLKDVGNRVANQRMVAPHRQRRGQIPIDAGAPVFNQALLAVVGTRQHTQRAPKRLDQRLMPETNP